MKKVKFEKFDREKIYDEHLAYDIKRGLYPSLKARKLKNGKYVFSKKKKMMKAHNEQCLTV